MPKRDSNKDPEYRRLTGQIARLPDDPPPPEFTENVMARISPKKPGFWRRLRLRLPVPPVFGYHSLPAAIMAMVLIGVGIAATTFWLRPVLRSPDNMPSRAGANSVNFVLDWPSAEKVAVLGSFNHWSPGHDLMHRNQSDGTWQLAVELPPGRYAYVFLVDDAWIIADPNALWEQDDEFGTRNSIVTIENGNSDENRI